MTLKAMILVMKGETYLIGSNKTGQRKEKDPRKNGMEGTADDIHGGKSPSSLTQDTGCLAAAANVSCNMSLEDTDTCNYDDTIEVSPVFDPKAVAS